jgi:hypothetical protein
MPMASARDALPTCSAMRAMPPLTNVERVVCNQVEGEGPCHLRLHEYFLVQRRSGMAGVSRQPSSPATRKPYNTRRGTHPCKGSGAWAGAAAAVAGCSLRRLATVAELLMASLLQQLETSCSKEGLLVRILLGRWLDGGYGKPVRTSHLLDCAL